MEDNGMNNSNGKSEKESESGIGIKRTEIS